MYNEKTNIYARVTRFFLNNSRLTALCLGSLVLFGIATVALLKITGFPSATVNYVIISTPYPGASANTVVEQITKPIENGIKDIDGIKNYTSTSSNSISTVSIEVKEGVNIDNIRSKIDSAVKSVLLPSGAEKPTLIVPKVSGDDYYYAMSRKDGSFNAIESYKLFSVLKTEIEKDSEVNKVQNQNGLTQKISIKVDIQKLTDARLSYSDITSSLASWGVSIPAAQDAVVDNKQYNLILSISGSSLEDLQNLRIISSTNPRQVVRLGDIATVGEIVTSNITQPVIGYREDKKIVIGPAFTFSIDIADNIDLRKYDPKLQKVLTKYFDVSSNEFKRLTKDEQELFSKYHLSEVFNVAKSNKDQVNEVIAGLIGEKWHIGTLGYIGFVFGGIQLVFLMMLALVSWRAAIIAALAIPLSFFFSTIIVKLTGNDLNTLVLFSLVLVIGLVVDPALVVLEAMQRSIDRGFPRRQAIIAAVNEIGAGLFLAVLTSMLVFIPFGVVSGIFGEIISYIPLTILPALVGSFVVPLIFLAWIGSFILKRSKSKTEDEEKNLWSAARWMMRVNRKVLNFHPIFRILIIALAVLVPIIVAGIFLGSGKVKQVSFAQPEDSLFLTASSENFPQKTPAALDDDNRAFVRTIFANENVKSVAPVRFTGRSMGYYITLKDRGDRPAKQKASKIAEDLQNLLQSNLGNTFFDVNVATAGIGPESSSFPIAIGIKTQDLTLQKTVAEDIFKIMQSVCTGGSSQLSIKKDCSNDNKAVLKVNGGNDATSVKFIEISVDRSKLQNNPVNPIDLRSIIASQYQINDGKKVGTFKNGGTDLDIVLESTAKSPNTIDAISKILIKTLDGRTIPLSTIATVHEVQSLESIRRVKGESVGVVSAKPLSKFTDQGNVAKIQSLVIDEFNKSYKSKYNNANLVVENYSEGDNASFNKSFQELFIALFLAIILTYIVLVVFFKSFLQPIVILFSIPLTFLGIFPALYLWGGGQLGFLEIIGIIILVGIVENVAIFLIDAANQKVKEGISYKEAIVYASGVRFRPIILTKVTALASTAPLAVLSQFYRSLSVVIIFGLLTSGILSLFISPILYVYFKYISNQFRSYSVVGKVVFAIAMLSIVLMPVALIAQPVAEKVRRKSI